MYGEEGMCVHAYTYTSTYPHVWARKLHDMFSIQLTKFQTLSQKSVWITKALWKAKYQKNGI